MESFDIKALSERDICSKYITPAIQDAGWDLHTQVREEVTFTAGRVIVRGQTAKRGKSKRADYILYHKPNIPIAVIEAKDNKHSVSDGLQQALGYAETLGLPFVFSSNGDAFQLHDRTVENGPVEQEIPLDQFPSPAELWERYRLWKGLDDSTEKIVTQDYYSDGSKKTPRYYQLTAINNTIEAIAKGQNRILLVMATGTGKTFTAFQIIWRLWKSGAKKRILFLADRNILIDQTRMNDFKPFGSAMTKISKRNVDKSYEIYLSLYQAVTGSEEEQNIYKQFSPDFFDLIVVDECHRGSAADDSTWRKILDYFSSATHVGLTATPKETNEVSNIDYFGKPVFLYSLKQGIQDGFLAPYKVIRIDIDKDLEGWRPEKGKKDKHGEEIEDRIYNQKDFDRTLILEKRTQLVAKRISDFLKATNRYDKAIVFCENIDHAERMRIALVNQNADIAQDNRKYIMRITGDNEEGKAELDNFIDPESDYPVIVTTSKLMTTGVDAQTCKLIVLDQRINSLSEFKQIIGRGTRINEDYDKLYFTIMDFKKATELFADPQFDGEPVQVYEPDADDPPVPPEGETDPLDETDDPFADDGEFPDPPPLPEDGNGEFTNPDTPGTRKKYVVDDVPVWVLSERIQYYDEDGNLITESLKKYTQKKILNQYHTLSDFLQSWKSADKKQAIIQELESRGVLIEALATEVGKDYGPFDLICHVAYDQPPLTRKERAQNVRKNDYFTKYGKQAKAVLDALLEKYADSGFEQLENLETLNVQPFTQLGTPMEIIKYFGGKQQYLQAIRDLENQLYECV